MVSALIAWQIGIQVPFDATIPRNPCILLCVFSKSLSSTIGPVKWIHG